MYVFFSGHYNQRETPAARERLKAEMEAKESGRQKKAKKTIEAFEAARQKWTTRLTHLKVLMSIISLGLGRSLQRRITKS